MNSEAIAQYFENTWGSLATMWDKIDFEYLGKLCVMLIEATGVTLAIFCLTLVFSIPLGMLVCAGKRCRFKPVSLLVDFYILIMRGTPLILRLIFIYFAPYYIFGFKFGRFTAAIIAFSINYAAYFAEIFRGGIEAMPIGQYEAASSLGFTKSQTFFYITLPQVVKKIIPASANEVITLVKDTALAQIIGVFELFAAANKQMGFKHSVMPLFVAGIFYFVLNWVVSVMFTKIEKKMDYYR